MRVPRQRRGAVAPGRPDGDRREGHHAVRRAEAARRDRPRGVRGRRLGGAGRPAERDRRARRPGPVQPATAQGGGRGAGEGAVAGARRWV